MLCYYVTQSWAGKKFPPCTAQRALFRQTTRVLDESIPELRNKPNAPKIPDHFPSESAQIAAIAANLKKAHPNSSACKCALAIAEEFGIAVP